MNLFRMIETEFALGDSEMKIEHGQKEDVV